MENFNEHSFAAAGARTTEAVERARLRMEAYLSSGNLLPTGKPTGLPVECQREKSSRQVDLEVTGSTTDAMGLLKRRPSLAKLIAPASAGKAEAIKRTPDFSKPVSRRARLVSREGATSFHFSCEGVSVTRGVRKTSETEQWVAPQHAAYLEREAAVATLSDNTATLPLGVHGGLYIEREGAIAALETDGAKAIFSNISEDDGEERQRFWRLVEQHASQPSPDVLEFDTRLAPAFWTAIAGDPDCPTDLRSAILTNPAAQQRYEGGCNEELRRLFARHGWTPDNSSECVDLSATKKADNQRPTGIVFRDGRGERVQLRIVGELPAEASSAGRERIVRQFASWFAARDLPYVAVMHAPDHTNNEENWHFHLAAYDRPCRRFVNQSSFIRPLPKVASKRQGANYRIGLEAIGRDDLNDYTGEWDFAVPVAWTTDCRHPRTSFPFAQGKDRACNKKSFPSDMRKLFAQIVNDELQREGHSRRYDPRRHDEMGIEKEPDAHLGTGASQLERFGVPTALGQENEAKQWRYLLNDMAKVHGEKMADIRRYARKQLAMVTDESGTSDLGRRIEDWERAASEAEMARAAAAEISQLLERARSRAERTKADCERHLSAIREGKASKRQLSNKGLYERRLREAVDHLAGSDAFFAEQARDLVGLQHSHRERTQEADLLKTGIEQALASKLEVNRGDRWRDMLDHVQPAVEAVGRLPTETSKPDPLGDFVRLVVERNRRLVTVDEQIRPRDATKEELQLVGSAVAQARLAGIKRKQDALLQELRNLIEAEPARIKATETKEEMLRVALNSSRGDLQRAFRSWAAEPELQEVVRKALTHARNAQLASRLRTLEAAAQRAFELAIPIRCAAKNEEQVYELPAEHLPILDLAKQDVGSAAFQRLLADAFQKQQAEIARVLGFAGKFPTRLSVAGSAVDEHAAAVLVEDAPPAVRQLFEKYRAHADLQAAMRKLAPHLQPNEGAKANQRNQLIHAQQQAGLAGEGRSLG